MSTVVIAAVGLIFTKCYDIRMAERQQAAATHEANERSAQRVHQERIAEIETLARLVPLLASADSSQKRTAFLVLRAILKSDSLGGADGVAGADVASDLEVSSAAGPRERSATTLQLISQFATLATAPETSPEESRRAVEAVAALARDTAASAVIRERATTAVLNIASDSSIPAMTREAAQSVLRSLPPISSPDSLFPDVAATARRLVALAAQRNVPIRILETYRSPRRQAAAYDARLTSVRSVGAHGCRVAFDVIRMVNGRASPNADLGPVGAIGKELGLAWGGEWRRIPDPFHFESPGAVRPPCSVVAGRVVGPR